ncbi:MAG: hypothetical protein RBT33_04275 [Candidatus Dojkabacteria bacterium]|jgi:hypothetical protein|nr:hypothetical protein [Candidatus Dojkabacteria bacterium]
MLQSYLEKIVQESESEFLSPRDIAIREIINLHEMKELDPRENEYSFSCALTIPIGYIDPYRERYFYDKLYGNTETRTFIAHYDDRCFLIRTLLSPEEYSFALQNIDRLHRDTFLNFGYEKEGSEYSSIIGYQAIPKAFAEKEKVFISFNVIG